MCVIHFILSSRLSIMGRWTPVKRRAYIVNLALNARALALCERCILALEPGTSALHPDSRCMHAG